MKGTAPPRTWASPARAIILDQTLWPISVCHLHGVAPAEDFDAWLAHMGRLLEQRYERRVVMVIDAANAGRSNLDQVRALGRWFLQHQEALARTSAGTILVLPAAAQRFALSTLLTITPMPDEYRVVGTLREALTKAELLLERAERKQ